MYLKYILSLYVFSFWHIFNSYSSYWTWPTSLSCEPNGRPGSSTEIIEPMWVLKCYWCRKYCLAECVKHRVQHVYATGQSDRKRCLCFNPKIHIKLSLMCRTCLWMMRVNVWVCVYEPFLKIHLIIFVVIYSSCLCQSTSRFSCCN